MNSEASRSQVIAKARSYLGAKWRHRGRKPWAIDCVGLVVLSLEAGGIIIPDDKYYGREPWRDRLQQKLQDRFGEPIHKDQWRVGDVALFKAMDKAPCHIGFLADYTHGGFSLLHSHAQHNVTEHALDDRWQRLLVEVYSPWAV